MCAIKSVCVWATAAFVYVYIVHLLLGGFTGGYSAAYITGDLGRIDWIEQMRIKRWRFGIFLPPLVHNGI